MSAAASNESPGQTGQTLSLTLSDGSALACDLVTDFSAEPPVRSIPRGAALAYLLVRPGRARFWTLGFEVPVDQVFVAATGRIVQVLERRLPEDDALLGPATDVALVLELAGGEARRLGTLPGGKLRGAVFQPDADPGFIAIVQSDRAGWFLACELRDRGYRIIHVHHTHHLDEVGEEQFDVELIYGDDLDVVVPRLRELGPSLVLAGSELGVNAADYLAEDLGLPGNGTLCSVARRDKAGMVETLRAAGFPVMRQLRTRSWKRIVRWMRHYRLSEIVIKPVRSAGTDRVSRARDPADVKRAVNAIIGATNRLGLAEVEVVAQERLFGPEIYLNSVSRAGRHAVSEIWLETKRPARGAPQALFAYDTFQLCPGDDVLAGYLGAWLARVLDALGVAWGPAHTELILTPEGPRLIDFGARLDGVLLPSLNVACIGRSPVQLTADAWLDPAAWEAFAATPYRLLMHATMVVIDNPSAGVLRDDTGLRELARLPTFHALRPRWEVGEEVPATKDAFSYHSIITLYGDDADAVRRDYEHIRRLEQDDLLLDVTPRVTPRIGAPSEEAPAIGDPRALPAWGEALAGFGWATVRDGELVAYLHDQLGKLLWVPRQHATLELAALERLREETGAERVVVELLPGARVVPLVGAPLELGTWSAEVEAAFDRVGLTPTMHAQAPAMLERAPAPEAPDPDVECAPLSEDAALVAFRGLGADASARWPAAIARAFAGHAGRLAVLRDGDDVLGAALGIVCEGAVHVVVASAREAADLTRLAGSVGAELGLPVIAPGTGISLLPGGSRIALPPALRWKRPAWAEHLVDLEAVGAALGAALGPTPVTAHADVLERFACREHPLALWGGALCAQAVGRAPIVSRTALIYRSPESQAPHGVVPHARRIELAALDALRKKHELLWIGWEPPPLGGDVVAPDGVVHALDWRDPERALEEAARLGLYPVRARWTPRTLSVVPLDPLGPLDKTAPPDPRVRLVTAADLRSNDWRRLEAIDEGHLEAAFAHPRAAARGLALGFARETVCAIAEDEDGVTSFALSVLCDRVAWCFMRGADPRAPTGELELIDARLVAHARAQGCDLMALYDRADAPEGAVAIHYPPTLARF